MHSTTSSTPCSWNPGRQPVSGVQRSRSVRPHFRRPAPRTGHAGRHRRPSATTCRILCTPTSFSRVIRTTPWTSSSSAVRDGRSIATRQVTVAQDGRTLLTAMASFHTNPCGTRTRPAATVACRRPRNYLCCSTGWSTPRRRCGETRDLDRRPATAGDADRGAAHIPGRCAGIGPAVTLDAPTARHRRSPRPSQRHARLRK